MNLVFIKSNFNFIYKFKFKKIVLKNILFIYENCLFLRKFLF